MSGKSLGGRGPRAPAHTSRSIKAGLTFPVGRITRYLRKQRITSRVAPSAGVYMAAVLEYLAAEIVELSGTMAKDHSKHRIVPRHIMLAVKNDEELNNTIGRVTFSQSGVLPHIQEVLLPKNRKTKGKSKAKGLVPEEEDGGKGTGPANVVGGNAGTN